MGSIPNPTDTGGAGAGVGEIIDHLNATLDGRGVHADAEPAVVAAQGFIVNVIDGFKSLRLDFKTDCQKQLHQLAKLCATADRIIKGLEELELEAAYRTIGSGGTERAAALAEKLRAWLKPIPAWFIASADRAV